MLEKMSDFFEKRLQGYDEHMLTEIESATLFYPFTAKQLPLEANSHILDLGCGTGLEIEAYCTLGGKAEFTGIDLSAKMLVELKRKLPDYPIHLICDSYFDHDLGKAKYDAAVSVESLHHFTKEEKIPLYQNLRVALKTNGYFILTDYFAMSEEEETLHRQTFIALKQEQHITDQDFYHYDTPLTVAHETEALLMAGFSHVEILNHWGGTYTLKALK